MFNFIRVETLEHDSFFIEGKYGGCVLRVWGLRIVGK